MTARRATRASSPPRKPSENKRDLADVPDETLDKLQPLFYIVTLNAAIHAMGLE